VEGLTPRWVTLSSSEVEFVAASQAGQEVLHQPRFRPPGQRGILGVCVECLIGKQQKPILFRWGWNGVHGGNCGLEAIVCGRILKTSEGS
jgi:hypothetical protein